MCKLLYVVSHAFSQKKETLEKIIFEMLKKICHDQGYMVYACEFF